MAISTKFSVLLALAACATLPAAQPNVVKYTLDVYYFPGSPDGVHKDNILGINGQSPGPTLEANVGDTLELTLINSIQDGQNVTMHWHGIDLKGSIFEDGASMITQCPLPQGHSMVYRVNVTTAGTFWYHSHVNSQYTEGMFGPLLVHGSPEAYRYDGQFTMMLSDWYHQTAHENEAWHLSPISQGISPYPNSGLINGMGRYPCNYAQLENRTCNPDLQLRQVFRVQRDKTYRIRIINSAAVAGFNFSIDYNQLNVIEADGTDVARPVAADIIPIASGQRYSFLVTCPEPVDGKNESRYIIRSTVRKESLMFIDNENINRYPEALIGNVTAILECVDEDLSRFENLVDIRTEKFSHEETVPPYTGRKMDVDEMALAPLDGIPAPDHFDEEFVLLATFDDDAEGVRRASFDFNPFSLPSDKPLSMQVLDGQRVPDKSYPLEIKYGDVIQVVINNPFMGPHPFHLHGHHFWILGLGEWFDGDYNRARHNLTVNGVKRDTVLVQERSWAVIRFVADNPGVWIFHCHIDWHVLSGMALTFVEGADILRNTTVISDEALRVCQLHEGWNRGSNNYISLGQ